MSQHSAGSTLCAAAVVHDGSSRKQHYGVLLSMHNRAVDQLTPLLLLAPRAYCHLISALAALDRQVPTTVRNSSREHDDDDDDDDDDDNG